jgi:site-specific DNA-methyltransferase (adenine-specific)
MSIIPVHISHLRIAEKRQRKEFKPESIVALANSISTIGLIHPVVIRLDEDGKPLLIAGERRMKAMQYVWNFGQTFKCAGVVYEEHMIPCIQQGDLSDIDAFEMELEENIKREDLSWQEKAAATSQLYELRRLQAEKSGDKPPTIADIASEVRGDSGGAYNLTREEILVSKNLTDPDIQKAKSATEAFKILKRKEEIKKSEALGVSVGKTFSAAVHQLFHGDCLEEMKKMESDTVDVFLTDPPYGIDAQKFGDSGGMTPGAHFYDDSFDTWKELMMGFSSESFRIAKNQAHAYVFCDMDNFVILKSIMSNAGWKCFRTPFIWVNPTAMRTPWVEMGPQRKYQICLYAVKGDKLVTRIYPDVMTYTSDENLNHPAQKPVDLYVDLLRRSVVPGNVVMDPFAGSGPIFPAAHEMKCKAIGIEQNAAAYGICVERLSSLK